MQSYKKTCTGGDKEALGICGYKLVPIKRYWGELMPNLEHSAKLHILYI